MPHLLSRCKAQRERTPTVIGRVDTYPGLGPKPAKLRLHAPLPRLALIRRRRKRAGEVGQRDVHILRISRHTRLYPLPNFLCQSASARAICPVDRDPEHTQHRIFARRLARACRLPDPPAPEERRSPYLVHVRRGNFQDHPSRRLYSTHPQATSASTTASRLCPYRMPESHRSSERRGWSGSRLSRHRFSSSRCPPSAPTIYLRRKVPIAARPVNFSKSMSWLRNGRGLPHHCSGNSVQRGQAAPKLAARKCRIAGKCVLIPRYRHIKHPGRQHRRSADCRKTRIIHCRSPDEAPGVGIHRISMRPVFRAVVAEICRPSFAGFPDRDRGAHAQACVEDPVNTSGSCVDGINLTNVASEEEPSAGHRRWSRHSIHSGNAERPLQLEAADVLCLQTSQVGGLCSAIIEIGTPAIPVASRKGPVERRMISRAKRLTRHIRDVSIHGIFRRLWRSGRIKRNKNDAGDCQQSYQGNKCARNECGPAGWQTLLSPMWPGAGRKPSRPSTCDSIPRGSTHNDRNEEMRPPRLRLHCSRRRRTLQRFLQRRR